MNNAAFSVITPSLNMGSYIGMCVASVADQIQGEVQHLVMDGGSTDETPSIIGESSTVQFISGRDTGMYDAINKGLEKAEGEIIGYLNCDEQYLPGTLLRIRDFFDRHPNVDMIFGDALLITDQGKLIAYRKGYPPRWPYILSSHLYLLSCTMFFRRRLLEQGLRFDNTFRAIGDLEFVVRALRQGIRARHLPGYTGVFTMTGKNLSLNPVVAKEWIRIREVTPRWVRVLGLPLNIARLTEKVLAGAYRHRGQLEYAIYTAKNTFTRTTFIEKDPRHVWRYLDAEDRD
jgi:glycosyltransferase involved in cell wall biosynthesis